MTEPMVLQRPVFEVDGWAGGTVDAEGVEWWITREDGWSSTPELRLDLVNRPQRDGAFDAPGYRGARVVTLEGSAIAPSVAAKERAKNRLAGVLADTAGLRELRVTEQGFDRHALVRLGAGTRIDDVTPYLFTFSLVLTAPDPLRYGSPRQAACALPQAAPGIRFPLTFPLVFGQPVGGVLLLDNAGTVRSQPVWELRGPVRKPVITQRGTGARLAFDLDLATGELLEIDTAARTVRLGAASRRAALAPGSTWFGLPPGQTAVAFTAHQDRNDTARLTAHWRDAWV
ncbi:MULTISPECIES: phage tail domain-containing protein [unclassified Crossiella]|uniref:phage distal tail protein n=1 Tax=unclassified Crossiella TaxID=2620835 RepID=UPI001FFEE62D|nr:MULTISPECIES: phage tail domain-containing protein [unclassified Crossiella]MCK2236446.1 phage tail family protein [Crossiella sp. S99.2]MCK2250113.1 phage tail family protein [Crossiella sp. S99.1]